MGVEEAIKDLDIAASVEQFFTQILLPPYAISDDLYLGFARLVWPLLCGR